MVCCAAARVGYVYPRLYYVPAADATTFGLNCYGDPAVPADVSVCELPRTSNPQLDVRRLTTLWREYQFAMGTQDLNADKQGVWSVDIHHVFDPVDRVLHLGDGRRRDAQDILTTVAGTGAIGFSGDGGPATQAKITDPDGLAVGPDGSVYFHDGTRHIRRIAPNGTISTIAGNGTFGYSADGTLATQASLGTIIPVGNDIAVGPDGAVYFSEGALGIVRKIAADGTLKTVAGDRTIAFCDGDNEPEDSLAARFACVNDGGPATQASLWGPYGITVGPDGTLYIGDGNHSVRRVGPDGIITTMAGGGHASYPCDYGNNPPWGNPTSCGEGGLARQAGFDVPWDFVVGPDGSLYVTDENAVIRRIGTDGVVTRIAGTGVTGFSGDGGPATSAQINGEGGIALGPDGSLYVGDFRRIRRINPAGIISTIAGDGLGSSCGQPNPPTCTSGELAAQATISTTRRLAVGADGSVYFGTFQNDHRVRRLTPFFRRYDAAGITIASDDGSEVYEFDANGRHLRTRDALTKHVLFLFGYDAAGRLTTVTDADNNVTTLQRDGSGTLTAIVSPFGKTTSLAFDARGYLATLTNPAGEVITAQHDTLGLLQTLRDAKNNPPTRFTYDSLGLLTRDSSATGSFLTLARAESDTSVSVTITSALNRTETFARIRLPNGTIRRLETDQAGLTTQRNELPNGTTVTTSPDGTVTSVTDKADPRFGMQAPFAGSFSVALPSALTLSGSSKRKVTLSDPLDPLSMTSQLDSLTLNGRVFTSAYDAAARTLTATSAVGRQTVTVLDTTGRVVEERVTGVAPVKYTYGARGFLTTVTQAGRLLQYDYDSSGRVKKVTDPLGRIEQFAYDSVGRITQQTLPDGRVIAYAYDANGNLTSLTPPTKPAHTFFYTVGDQDSIYSPSPAGLSSFKTNYLYNLDRQLTQITRPDSLTIAIGYDNAGRPNGLSLPNGTVTFGYHTTSGLLNSLSSATGGSLAYAYDGALPTLATWTGTVAGSVGYTYDNNFRVSALTVNGANSISLGYDNDNLLTNAGSLTLSRSSQNGRLTGTSLGSVATTLTYDDSVGTLKRSTATYTGNTLLDFQYTRDTLDRITQIIENVQGTMRTWAYVYDSVGRLDQVRLNGTLVSDYAYDGNGNRTGLTTQSGTVTAAVDDQDRLLSYGTNNYTYTSNGDLTRKVASNDTTRYTYDVLGNLLQVKLPNGTTIDYLVDGLNRRIGKKVNSVLTQGFLYQGQLAPIAELDGTNQVVSRFVFGMRPNAPEVMIKSGVTYRLLTDHLGSVRLVVNTNTGAVAQRIDYDEFGRVTQNTNPGFQPFGYAGGLYDADAKLVRFGARDYDPETGRWTSKDVLGLLGVGYDPNVFSYVENDPINYVDSTGLCRNWWELLKRIWARLNDDSACGVKYVCITVPGWIGGPARATPLEAARELERYEEYWRGLTRRASERASPYGIRNKYDVQGNLRGATTYDQFGNRAHQYEFGGRHGPGQHDYGNTGPYTGFGKGPRGPHIPWP